MDSVDSDAMVPRAASSSFFVLRDAFFVDWEVFVGG